MRKITKIVIEILLGITALGCLYGIGSSIAKPIKEHNMGYDTVEESRDGDEDTMYLYDLNGAKSGSMRAYKGEWDGHTWYVFRDGNGTYVVKGD